jgi:hypothetical protein
MSYVSKHFLILSVIGCLGLIAQTLLFPLPASAQLVFTETWDDGNEFSGWVFDDKCQPYNFSIVADPANSGSKVVRIENRLTPCTYTSGHYVARTELQIPYVDSMQAQYGQDYWIGIRVYIPSNWRRENLPTDWFTVMQLFHGNNQVGYDQDFKFTIWKDNTWFIHGPGQADIRGTPIKRGA